MAAKVKKLINKKQKSFVMNKKSLIWQEKLQITAK